MAEAVAENLNSACINLPMVCERVAPLCDALGSSTLQLTKKSHTEITKPEIAELSDFSID
jgi:hypothetical protein